MTSRKLKILTLIGTRPDTIKMAPIIFELISNNNTENILCGTGQHREMLNQALDIFGLVPNIDLNVMTRDQKLETLAAKLIVEISKTVQELNPDLVLVHGDTLTAFCGALASYYCKVPVVHIEAGLRTHNILEPFPEEFNRQAIARIADLNFAPTSVSLGNLMAEGISENKIIVSGNTVVDSLNIMSNRINSEPEVQRKIFESFKKYWTFNYRESKFVLVTLHRRENFGYGVTAVCAAIKLLANRFSDIKFVFPVHLNPKVSEGVLAVLGNIENIFLTPPLPYDEFVALLSSSMFVITDSGGIQEEAVSLGKKVLVTRNVTERKEGFESGLLKIVACDPEKIAEVATEIIRHPTIDNVPVNNPFGNVGTSKLIVEQIVINYLNKHN